MAVVLFMSSLVSASSTVIEIEDDSNFLACIRSAQALVTASAEENGQSPNDNQIYMDIYLSMVDSCADQYL